MKKSQKKFQKYFSYQPGQKTDPGVVKLPFTLFTTAPRTHLSKKNLRLLGKSHKLFLSLTNLIFLFKKNWNSLGKGNKSSFSLVSLVFRYRARRSGFARTRGNHKKSERQLSQPLEYRLIKLSCLGLLTFLVTLATVSAFAPVQNTNADEVLLAAQTNGSLVSLSTSGNVNLSLIVGASGAVRTAEDTVKVTSGENGYQLYMSVSGSSASLLRDGGSSENVSDIIPTLTDVSISSPTNLLNNTWGFAVAKQNSTTGSSSEDVVATGFDETYPTGDNSSASSKFASIPTKGNDILIAKRSSTATAVPTTFYYGAKVTSSKASGLYRNTIVYTAIGNSTVEDMASVTPERTDKVAGGEELSIATPSTLALSSIASTMVTVGGETCLNPTPSKNNAYTNITCFAPALATGWHEVIVTITTTEGTEESYVVNPGIEYYSPEPTMQDFTLADCQKLAINTSTSLIDVRDGNRYTVARLADNNCWMTTNLMLGNTIINSGSIEINSSTSDYSGNAFTISSSNVMAEGKTNNWTSNDFNVLHIYARPASDTDENGNMYGNLYNWYTSTAKSGSTSVSSGNVANSICPKGWKLPANTGNPSFTKLFQAPTTNGGLGISSTSGTVSVANKVYTDAMKAEPYNMPNAGRWRPGVLEYIEQDASFWSRTAHDYNSAYYFVFDVVGSFNFQNDGYSYRGRSLRCVMAF